MRLFPSVLAVTALATGCTFNVGWVERDLVASEAPVSFTTLALEASTLEDASLSVRGGALGPTTATVHVAGLVGATEDESLLLSEHTVAWSTPARDVASLEIGRPSEPSALAVEWVAIDLPADRDVVVESEGDVEIAGVIGRVEARTGAGSILVADAGVVELSAGSGSIAVQAEAGNVHTGSGSIALDLAGWVDASAESGSITGRIGDGGSIRTASGSIDVVLDGVPGRDLVLDAESGSIHLVVPAGASLSLDLRSESGSVIGGRTHGGRSLVVDLGAGGPLVVARTASGSIVVEERGR